MHVGARAVLKSGSRSLLSRAENPIVVLALLGEEGEVVIPESSAVGSAIAVIIVLLVLRAGVAYFGHNNRVLRRRFTVQLGSYQCQYPYECRLCLNLKI